VKSRYRFDIKRMSADCEANYLRLRRLLPGLLELAASAKAVPDRTLAVDVYAGISRQLTVEIQPQHFVTMDLKLVEQCRYTSTLEITVAMHEPESDAGAMLHNLSRLNMTVRLYHDVKLAEVVSMAGKRLDKASYSYPNDSMFLPDEKAQQNRLLGEWLGLSLVNGLTANTDMLPPFAASASAHVTGGSV